MTEVTPPLTDAQTAPAAAPDATRPAPAAADQVDDEVRGYAVRPDLQASQEQVAARLTADHKSTAGILG